MVLFVVTRDLQLMPSGEPMLHRCIFEAVRSRVPSESPIVRKLLENGRMNDVLTSFAAGLLYDSDYRCFDDTVADRRLRLDPNAQLAGLAAACLDPAHPMTVVILEGLQATKKNLVEARLVAELVLSLREHQLDGPQSQYADDQAFFRHGVFVVSPHRAQNRAIRQELLACRKWEATPFVDIVDKMQGQEADVVLVSYGVSDPEFAVLESEFIYSLNRLNVPITRARTKSVVFLPRPLLESLPRVLEKPDAEHGLAFMRNIVDATSRAGPALALTS